MAVPKRSQQETGPEQQGGACIRLHLRSGPRAVHPSVPQTPDLQPRLGVQTTEAERGGGGVHMVEASEEAPGTGFSISLTVLSA